MLDFTVLLIENDPSFRLLIRLALEVLGGVVFDAADMVGGLRTAYESSPDVAVVGLTDEDAGLQCVERLRDVSALPIVAVGLMTDRDTWRRASDAGANAYVSRESTPERIAQRVSSLVTRSSPNARRVYVDDRLHVDFAGIDVRVDGKPVLLTPLEYRVLECLVRRPGSVLSSEELAREAWRGEGGDPDRVKPHIGGLRRKLGGLAPRVMTLRGKGYSYRPFDR